MRDDFAAGVKRTLGLRVNFHCSHPQCRVSTIGPGVGPSDVVSVGVAAHITAASPGGARYDSSLTQADRVSIENGIWLCQIHAREIDVDPLAYSVELLRGWKRHAEDEARQLRGSLGSSGVAGQAPLHMPQLPSTGRTRLSFASRSTPFVGRDDEWDTLQAFLDREDPFVWTTVSGPAGSGKSRLLLEFCLAVRAQWQVGFLDFLRPGFNWDLWAPSGCNLIILDYASTFSDQVRRILASLEGRTVPDTKIRVILADRIDADALHSRLFTGSDAGRLLAYADDRPLQLQPLSREHVAKLTAAILEGSSLEVEDLPFESRFPLFAAIVAHLRSEGIVPRAMDRTTLVRGWLDRERSKYWEPAGVTKSEIRLACLASAGGAIDAETALSGDLHDCGINLDDVEARRYEALTGLAPLDRFEPFTPDILGEYLLLETLYEQNPSNALSKSLLQRAWSNSPESCAGFMQRVSEDFPAHVAIMKVTGFVPLDKPTNSTRPNLGRPTLPTIWAEAVPRLNLKGLSRQHRAAVFDTIVQACQTKLDHEVLKDLRHCLGDRIFDDPLCLQGQVIAYSLTPYEWDFAQARDLALRISDIRNRLAILIDTILFQLRDYDESDIDKVVQASDYLLQGGRNDQRVRGVMFNGLMGGMKERFESGDIARGQKLWRQMVGTLEWWISNPTAWARNEAKVLSPSEQSASGEEEGGDSHLQDLWTDRDGNRLTVSCVTFVSNEDPTDRLFLDAFGKSASNYIQFNLGKSPNDETLAYCQEALRLILNACAAAEGTYELPGRFMEGAAYFVKHYAKGGNFAAVERFVDQARKVAAEYPDMQRDKAPGLGCVFAHKISGLTMSGDIIAADEAFDAFSPEIGVPDKVAESEIAYLAVVLCNLATAHGNNGNIEQMNRYSGILDEIARSATAAAPLTLEGRILIRRNKVSWGLRDSRLEEVVTALRDLEKLSETMSTPQQAVFVLSALEAVLLAESSVWIPHVDVFISMVRQVCRLARNFKPGQVDQILVNSCFQFTEAFALHDLEAAKHIVDAVSAFAESRFSNGAELTAMLHSILFGRS